MNLVSFGGGTNSAAMIIGMHERGIPIDLIIFADTGGERPDTYAFIDTFSEWLKTRGLPEITIVRYATKGGGVQTLEQDCEKQRGLPGVAYGRPDCAVKYKLQPQEKYCNNNANCRAVWARGEKIDKYVGYDAGEARRINKNQAKYAADKKYEHHHPLFDWGWGRDECVSAIERAGLPLPGKSSCFFCPNNKKAEIQKLWESRPDLFDRAVAMERNARKAKRDGTPSSIIGLGRTWTWEEYRAAYMHNEAFKASHYVIEGFEDITGGCCCGMPCGCNDG